MEGSSAYILRIRNDPCTGHVASPTREQWAPYYAAIMEKLVVGRGRSWEQRLQILLAKFQMMVQSRHEWVAEYAHWFRENDHMLRKLFLTPRNGWARGRLFRPDSRRPGAQGANGPLRSGQSGSGRSAQIGPAPIGATQSGRAHIGAQRADRGSSDWGVMRKGQLRPGQPRSGQLRSGRLRSGQLRSGRSAQSAAQIGAAQIGARCAKGTQAPPNPLGV